MAGLRRYQIANADRVREWKRSRENKRRAVKASVTIEDFQAVDVFIRDGWVCGICDDQVDRSLRWPHPMSASLDHVIPLSRGGAHALSNVQLAHLRCNVRKGDSLP
jgi:5-methylcytosine-specific restriction endonuclease McrA